MNATGNNPVIENRIHSNNEILHFTFKGRFTESDARNAVLQWNDSLRKGDAKLHHIWDCREMSGYDPMARIEWQKAIKELKNRIEKIWLISDSSLIIAGAMILSTFTTLEIKAVKSEEQVSF